MKVLIFQYQVTRDCFARTEHMITDQKGEERVTKEDFGTKDRERNTENLIN